MSLETDFQHWWTRIPSKYTGYYMKTSVPVTGYPPKAYQPGGPHRLLALALGCLTD